MNRWNASHLLRETRRVRVSGSLSSVADEYEREHMPGIGEVLFRQKTTTPPWLVGLITGLPLIGGTIFAAVGMIDGLGALPALGIVASTAAGSALMGALFVVFSGGRIAISEGELHIQLGPAGPRVPIETIRSVTIGASGINKFGLGVQKHLDGTTIFSFFGDNARSVRIERDGAAPLVLVCKEPDAVAAALHEAMARNARKAAAPQVRVADGNASEEESENERSRSDRERSA